MVFSEHQGGYIDNVPSTIGFVPGSAAATTGVTGNNANLVANNTNPVDYQGFRLSALWKMNDDWSLLLQQNYQDMNAQGYFYTYPDRLERDAAATVPDHRLHARLEQGQVREHVLDGERQAAGKY